MNSPVRTPIPALLGALTLPFVAADAEAADTMLRNSTLQATISVSERELNDALDVEMPPLPSGREHIALNFHATVAGSLGEPSLTLDDARGEVEVVLDFAITADVTRRRLGGKHVPKGACSLEGRTGARFIIARESQGRSVALRPAAPVTPTPTVSCNLGGIIPRILEGAIESRLKEHAQTLTRQLSAKIQQKAVAVFAAEIARTEQRLHAAIEAQVASIGMPDGARPVLRYQAVDVGPDALSVDIEIRIQEAP